MSQALTLKEKLESRGHEIITVFIGAKNQADLPSFFTSAFNCPIQAIKSPSFKLDKHEQGIILTKSVFYSFANFLPYFRSIKKIRNTINLYKPDAIISFYEPLMGSYLRFYRDKRPCFFIGHQYFMDHPAFEKYFKKITIKEIFKIYNLFTAPKKNIKIALSFTEEKDLPSHNIFVCPPLIKNETKGESEEKDFFLVYLLNKGYKEEIIKWSKNNPGKKIEAFSRQDKKEEKINDDLTFHNLSGEEFSKMLKTCKAYISTAGFESIAEAAYLGKKIMMVPTKNHFEQEHNAIDAKRAKIAIKSDDFDLSLIEKCSNDEFSGLKIYKDWYLKNENKIINIIEENC